jgi:hypothetical protein
MSAKPGLFAKIKSRLTIILCIALVAAGAASAYFFFQDYSANSQIAAITDNYTTVQGQYSLLQTSDGALKSVFSSLQSSYGSLQSSYNSSQMNLTTLQIKFNTLNANYTSLNNNYTSLQNTYSALQVNYSQLTNSYNSLKNATNDKGIAIESIIWNRGNMSDAGITNVFITNLCSSDVHVISMKLYYNNILQSSSSLDEDIPGGNATVNIQVFLPPSTYNSNDVYILKIFTLEGYNATSDPLPLCQ